jgi:1,4-dihydroxy-6-naphthoate synthase
MKLSLAFSPCPNDTFIFAAMVGQKIDTEGLEFDVHLADVETLNTWAMESRMQVTKVSYHAYLYLTRNYALLDAGSALGKGNGPLLISNKKIERNDERRTTNDERRTTNDERRTRSEKRVARSEWRELSTMTIAVPGEYTTANLLLKIAFPELKMKRFMVFNRIEGAILDGTVDAGVIIHENRFTYEAKGLVKIADLGDLWEQRTQLPIPLGGIVARRSLGYDVILTLERVMKRSVRFAMDHPEEVMDYVRAHAQEMQEEVMEKHIRLYVNDFTLSLGTEGRKAVQKLFDYNDTNRSYV